MVTVAEEKERMSRRVESRGWGRGLGWKGAEDTILNLMVSRKVIFEERPEEKGLSNLEHLGNSKP